MKINVLEQKNYCDRGEYLQVPPPFSVHRRVMLICTLVNCKTDNEAGYGFRPNHATAALFTWMEH